MKIYLKPGDIDRLEQVATNLRDKILIHFLFGLGLRMGKALALKVDDINLAQGTITIIHPKRRLKLSCPSCSALLGMAHLICPRCGGKIERTQAKEHEYQLQRVLPIEREALKMVREYVERGGPDGKQLLFGIAQRRGWQIVRDCAFRAGCPELSTRRWPRHTT